MAATHSNDGGYLAVIVLHKDPSVCMAITSASVMSPHHPPLRLQVIISSLLIYLSVIFRLTVCSVVLSSCDLVVNRKQEVALKTWPCLGVFGGPRRQCFVIAGLQPPAFGVAVKMTLVVAAPGHFRGGRPECVSSQHKNHKRTCSSHL